MEFIKEIIDINSRIETIEVLNDAEEFVMMSMELADILNNKLAIELLAHMDVDAELFDEDSVFFEIINKNLLEQAKNILSNEDYTKIENLFNKE